MKRFFRMLKYYGRGNLMKISQYTSEKMVFALRQAELGTPKFTGSWASSRRHYIVRRKSILAWVLPKSGG
jgi:hypothetical protein